MMALVGTTNEQKIWNFLLPIFSNNTVGVAAMIGAGTYPESGNISTNLEKAYEKKLGYTDATYTTAVDKGTYTKDQFVNDHAGYGICQWTYWSRKKALYEYCKSKGVSIGDLQAQLEYLVIELKQYGLLTKLQQVKDLRTASNIILLEFEKPGSKDTQATQDRRFGYTQDVYNRLAKTNTTVTTSQKGETTMGYTNSSLATYTNLTKHHSGQRTHTIDRITIHCFVGQVTAKSGTDFFVKTTRSASCNYVVGKDGDIGLSVEEKNRSWCTSSNANDQRAITIETASGTAHPYTITDKAYQALITLCADICRRNGKKKLTWLADKDKSINYTPAPNEMIFTVHRWFAAKACPGDYIYNRLGNIATEVNKLLGSATTSTSTTTKPATQTTSTATKKVSATKAAQDKDSSLSGTYIVNAASGLNMRNGAGTQYAVLVTIPNGTKVTNYGYYTICKKVKWLYVQFVQNNTTYTGFVSSQYLKKA